MNLKYKKSLILFYFIAISLLIHLILSLFFLEFSFKSRVKSLIKNLSQISNLSEQERKYIEKRREERREALQKIFESVDKKPKNSFPSKPKDTLPAKLVAPKSNFGWVIFDENHKQPDKLEVPPTKIGEVGVTNVSNATELKPKIDTHKTDSKTASVEKNNKLEKSRIQRQAYLQAKKAAKPKKTAVVLGKNIPENKDNLVIDQARSVKLAEEKNIQERIKKIEAMQQLVEQYKKPIPVDKHQEKETLLASVLKKNKAKQSTGPVWGAASVKPKNSRNVIALTKGYIEKLDGENGTDLIDRDGDPNKRPYFEEMKYISYEAKLDWSCQATWKQNCEFYNLPIFAGEYRLVIGFTIGEKGELLDSEILESSGNKTIDSAVIKNLEFTAPFPPLPKHFGMSSYSTGRVVHVFINKMVF